jgi:hypothetical protein
VVSGYPDAQGYAVAVVFASSWWLYAAAHLLAVCCAVKVLVIWTNVLEISVCGGAVLCCAPAGSPHGPGRVLGLLEHKAVVVVENMRVVLSCPVACCAVLWFAVLCSCRVST